MSLARPSSRLFWHTPRCSAPAILRFAPPPVGVSPSSVYSYLHEARTQDPPGGRSCIPWRSTGAFPCPRAGPAAFRSGVIHAISLAHFSLTFARGVAANNINKTIRLQADVDRLRQEIALLREEIRIKDRRMLRIPAQRRTGTTLPRNDSRSSNSALRVPGRSPKPLNACSLLRPRSPRGCTASTRTDPLPLFASPSPSTASRNSSDTSSVGSRRSARPWGRGKIAQVLCRAGLHLGATSVRRMLAETDQRRPKTVAAASMRVVRAKRPNEVHHVDLSTVPTTMGFWTAWLPFALPQRWPFCWWIAIVVDHYSRRAMGVALFMRPPSSAAVRSFLERVARKTGTVPKYLITDHGKQFAAKAFARWCRGHCIRQRFGAIGKYGSLAVVERFIRTVKTECTRRILVPFRLADFQCELSFFVRWYNAERPHTSLEARTPDEVYFRRRPACRGTTVRAAIAVATEIALRGTAGARPWPARCHG